MMLLKKVAIAGALCALSTTPIAVVAAPANADPASCGVRSELIAGQGTSTYVVRNRCQSSHSFRVRVNRIWSGCKRIDGSRYGYFGQPGPLDENWTVQVC